MSQTDAPQSEQLAGALFDEVIVPIAQARSSAEEAAYFPLEGDAGVTTYFVEPSQRTMSAGDFQPHAGTAQGLVDAVTALWAAQGEIDLVALAPRMTEIAEALSTESAESDGMVDVLCYTLF